MFTQSHDNIVPPTVSLIHENPFNNNLKEMLNKSLFVKASDKQQQIRYNTCSAKIY